MRTLKSIFDKASILHNGEIEYININKEDRKMAVYVSFPSILTYMQVSEMEKEICRIYKLADVVIHPKYSGVLNMEYVREFVCYLGDVVDYAVGALKGCLAKLENGKLTLQLQNALISRLNTPENVEIAENIIKEQFNQEISVEFTAAEDKQQMHSSAISRNEKIIKDIAKEAESKKVANSFIIYGKNIEQEITPLTKVKENEKSITVQGEIFQCETRLMRNGKFIFNFDITDYEDSLSCVLIGVEKDACDRISSRIKEGTFVAVRGIVSYDDKYTHDLNMRAFDINEREDSSVMRMDNAEEKRVELHLHTQMSSMDGFTDVAQVVKRASKWGHKALAITDHGVVQNFPFAAKAAKGTGVKLIYGVEAYLVDDGVNVCENSKNQGILDNIIVFDIETTGLVCHFEKIIEIGAVKIVNGEIVDRFSEFVNPKRNISSRITQLTGINGKMVENANTIDVVFKEFMKFCGDGVIVAHNATFDCGFIRKVAEELNIEYDFTSLDTLELARLLLPDLKNHRLDTVASHLQVHLVGHHRAVNDAEATAEIYMKLAFQLGKLGITTLNQIDDYFSGKVNIKKRRPTHCVIYAKTLDGLHNMYRLITASHIDNFYRKPLVPLSMVEGYKDGFIIGSACEQGDLFKGIVSNVSKAKLDKWAKFYDFFEVQPLGNNDFMVRNGTVPNKEALITLNKMVIDLGERYNKPVVATGDVHFLDPRDAKYREVIQGGQGYDDADMQAPLYFRTTEEMLEEFQYLPQEKAYEIVVKNTNAIVEMVEDFPLLPKEACPPIMEEAPDEITNTSHEKARRIYGDNLPPIVKERMDKELGSIIKHGFSVMYYIARKLVKKSNSDGYLVGSRGSVGSSFIAFLTDITEVNALPPHYICPKCKNSEFITDGSVACGVDMDDKICPVCGEKYNKDGHDIPFETFLGFDGDKAPDIDLNFSGEYQAKAHKYTEVLFGEGYTFKAGTISALQEKTAIGFIKKYHEEKQINCRRVEERRLAKGCTGVKRTTGQHPGGIIIVPHNRDIHEFCPVQRPADKQDTDIKTTHFDFHSIDQNLLKLDILGHDDPSIIRMLEDLTGIDATKIPLDDKETMSLFANTSALGVTPEQINSTVGTFGVPEFGTSFVRQMLVDTKPTTFSELVRISGLSHGTDVWLGNAKDVIANGEATLKDAICTRDDIMIYLIYAGVPKKTAFDIMEHVRKGKGLTPDEEAAMRENNVPEWYINSCKKIKYMFPKAHAVAYVTMAYRIAYCKVHYAKEYYIAYFSIRAKDFNVETMCGGYQDVVKLKKALESNPDASEKDKSSISTVEMVIEMNARGIEFLPIDLYESEAFRFKSMPNGILPPLSSIPGLGDTVAETMVAEREKQPFDTKDDLRNRGKVSKTIVESLEKMGCLNGMPESNQMDMFELC